MSLARWSASLLVSAVLFTGCSATSTDPHAGATPAAKGPLTLGRLVGDTQIMAPSADDWWAGFGSFVPCTTHSDSRVVVQRVRTASDAEPLQVQVFRRRVSPDLVRRTPRAQRPALGPRFTYLGHPPRFAEPYVTSRPGGAWVGGVRGEQVTVPCTQVEDAEDAVSRGDVPRTGFDELVFAMRVDRSGARITDAFVDYTVGGDPGTLHLRWVMVACGDRFTDPDQCRPPVPAATPLS